MMISLDDRLDRYQSLDFIDPGPYRGPMTTMAVTSMGTFHPAPDTLDELAWAIDGDGIGFHEAAIARVVTWARALGFDPVLLDVLADPAQPRTARERAFGALTRTVANGGPASRRPSDPRRVAA
jgi:hypothetical protein